MQGMPAIGAMAERAASAAGLEFTPNPAETMSRAGANWASPRALLVTYDSDDLDQNAALAAALEAGAAGRAAAAAASGGGAGGRGRGSVETAKLKGNHLTPVVLELQGAQLGPQLGRLGAIRVGDAAAARELAGTLVDFLRKP